LFGCFSWLDDTWSCFLAQKVQTTFIKVVSGGVVLANATRKINTPPQGAYFFSLLSLCPFAWLQRWQSG